MVAAAVEGAGRLTLRHGVVSDGLLRHGTNTKVLWEDRREASLVELEPYLAFFRFQHAKGKLDLKLVAPIHKVSDFFDNVPRPGENHVLGQRFGKLDCQLGVVDFLGRNQSGLYVHALAAYPMLLDETVRHDKNGPAESTSVAPVLDLPRKRAQNWHTCALALAQTTLDPRIERAPRL